MFNAVYMYTNMYLYKINFQFGENVKPDNIVAMMLKINSNWTAIREFFKTVIMKKEEDKPNQPS